MDRKELLIIIPAYNEEKNIPKVLDQLEKPEITSIADVLVMNDASTDMTGEIVKARHHMLATHVYSLGYGSGLQLGYKYAVRRGYRYVIQMDADGQHDVCNIPGIYKRLKEKDESGKYPDIVLASRFMEGSSDFPVSSLKNLAYKMFRIMIRIYTGRRIADPTTGLQGLSRRAFLYYSRYSQFDERYPDANMNRREEYAFRAEARLVYASDVFECLDCCISNKDIEDGCRGRTEECGQDVGIE